MLGFIVSVDFAVSVSQCKEPKVGEHMSENLECKSLCSIPNIIKEFLTRTKEYYEIFVPGNRCHCLDSNLVVSEHKSGILLPHHSGDLYHPRNIALQYF